MFIEAVIHEVEVVNEMFLEAEGLSIEYQLSIETNGDDWNIIFLREPILQSEEYDEDESLYDQIMKGLKDIQLFLNAVLK